jgi:hypothetical protein
LNYLEEFLEIPQMKPGLLEICRSRNCSRSGVELKGCPVKRFPVGRRKTGSKQREFGVPESDVGSLPIL